MKSSSHLNFYLKSCFLGTLRGLMGKQYFNDFTKIFLNKTKKVYHLNILLIVLKQKCKLTRNKTLRLRFKNLNILLLNKFLSF